MKPHANIKTTCVESNDNVCAVIAVLAVLKTAITAKTAETARYIQRIYSLIFREKWSCNGFLRTFENILECILRKSVGISIF